ncbi:MAG: hypothetical protein ACYCVG_01425 [Leptospirillum sp.]
MRSDVFRVEFGTQNWQGDRRLFTDDPAHDPDSFFQRFKRDGGARRSIKDSVGLLTNSPLRDSQSSAFFITPDTHGYTRDLQYDTVRY